MSSQRTNGLLIIISSPSGAGKTTICKRLLDENNSICISISDTTRSPRNNEINGHDYNFISEGEFKRKIINNEYLEFAKVFGNYYGSLRESVNCMLNAGNDVLFDIDWQGAEQIKKSSYSNMLSFFIMPPSKEVIYERLHLRAKMSGDDEASINKRMSMFEIEMSHQKDYDHIVINEDIETCLDEIKKIIEQKKLFLVN